MVFVTEEVESMELVGLYPVNALRNKALMLSQTEVRERGAGGRGWGGVGGSTAGMCAWLISL